MPVPLPPEALGDLHNGPFSFYPAIVGFAHNEWVLSSATWTEVHVANTRTGDELWIPRHFVGEVVRIENPVTIVGLLRELEYRQGALIPHRRRVIEMPRAVNGPAPMASSLALPSGEPPRLAPVVAIRTEAQPSPRGHRLFRGSVALGILACVATGFVLREANPRFNGSLSGGSWYRTAHPVELTPQDDYRSIVQKLGRPLTDQWQRSPEGAEYRRLLYPRLGVAILLKGPTHGTSRYAGIEELGPAPQWRTSAQPARASAPRQRGQ